jgi:hypothetical protein
MSVIAAIFIAMRSSLVNAALQVIATAFSEEYIPSSWQKNHAVRQLLFWGTLLERTVNL